MFIEELGHMFRSDPLFSYIFKLPYGCLKAIIEKKKSRVETNPLESILASLKG